jgi:DNA polymerase III subunit delta
VLSNLIGEDTRLANQEIIKLLDYVNYARPVEIEDIQLLTPDASQVDDFALVNALRERNSRKAQAVLHRKLEEEEPVLILGSMIYQFRLLLLAREIIDEGGSQQEVIDQLAHFEIKPYPAKLAHENAHRFSSKSLQDIYHRLVGN